MNTHSGVTGMTVVVIYPLDYAKNSEQVSNPSGVEPVYVTSMARELDGLSEVLDTVREVHLLDYSRYHRTGRLFVTEVRLYDSAGECVMILPELTFHGEVSSVANLRRLLEEVGLSHGDVNALYYITADESMRRKSIHTRRKGAVEYDYAVVIELQ